MRRPEQSVRTEHRVTGPGERAKHKGHFRPAGSGVMRVAIKTRLANWKREGRKMKKWG